MKKFFSSLLLLLAGASLCALEITLPAKPLPSEKNAAQELRSYLERTVDGELKIGGRHDPCIAPRAVPVVEAAAAIALLDALLEDEYER